MIWKLYKCDPNNPLEALDIITRLSLYSSKECVSTRQFEPFCLLFKTMP
jgi:hypothetical protein